MKKKITLIFSFALSVAILFYSCSKTSDLSNTKNAAQNNPDFNLPNGQHYYGCILATADEIAKVPRYSDAHKSAALLPSSVTLAHPPVGDQGQQGSCTGWGAANTDGIFYYYKAGLSSWSTSTDIMSASFIYNNIKIGSCNSGSYITYALNRLKKAGDCIYNDMTYTDQSCSARPTTAAKNNAALHKINSYLSISVSDINSIKSALSSNHPVIIGIQVDNNFEALNSSNYTWNPNNSTILGGHCNTIYGYDDSKSVFLVENQWGTNWGNGGLYYISYSMFTSSSSKVVEVYEVE